MALQKDTVSINLAKSVNTKTDEKIAQPDQLSVLRDARFNEDFALEKRLGMNAQPTSVLTSFPNPLPIAATDIKSMGFAHENQQCIQNSGALYSQYEGQDKWAFKGHYYPIGVNSTKLNANVEFTDSVTTAGMTALAGGGFVYLREDVTGNIVSINTVSNILRLVAFSNAIWVLWRSTNTLKAQQINFTDGSLSAAIDLVTDLIAGGQPATPGTVLIATTTAASAVGEMAFVTYRSNSTSTIKVLPFDSSGAIPALGTLNTSINGTPMAIYIEPSDTASKFYVSYLEAGNIGVTAYTFSSSTYTNVFNTVSVFPSSSFNPNSVPTQSRQATFALDPVGNSGLYVFLSVVDANPVTNSTTITEAQDAYMYYAVVDKATGSITSAISTYGRGYVLAANAIRDVVRKTIYLPCVYVSPLQTSCLLLDVLKGRSDTTTWMLGRWLYGLAGFNLYLSQCLQTEPGSGVYRFTNHGSMIDVDLYTENAAQTQYFAKTTHMTGGMLWAYDGQTVAEHNFMIDPERIEYNAGTQGATIIENQAGTASLPEIFTISFYPAIAFFTGSGYIGFNSPTGSPSAWYIWFKVDGNGADPAPGGRTSILVNLTKTDSADDVCAKTLAAIQSVVASSLFNYSMTPQDGATPAKLQVTARNNGATTAPTNQLVGPVGNLSAGAYQYCVVWRWTDRNGQIYRSAPSVPYSVTSSAGGIGSLLIWAPAITNKPYSDVVIEIYRTQANQTTFHLVSELQNALTFSAGTTRFTFQDFASDAAIADEEILYTDGGILENFGIGACSSVNYFKERLVVNYSDDPYAVYYSKSNVVGEPVNFTQETFFRVDAEASPITALETMDDKLCVFKRPFIYAVTGDGANDLGQSSTLTAPLLIASDAGANDPNTIIRYPNGLLFKSDKGIYGLNRSLSVEYTGAPVEAFNSFKVVGGVLMEDTTEIRYLLGDSSTSLIYNYFYKRWDYFTNMQSDYCWLWKSRFCRITNAGVVYVESDTNYFDNDGMADVPYSMYLETPWMRLKGVQDFQRIYRLSFLGEYFSPHTLKVTVFYDYDMNFSDVYEFNGADLVSGTFPGDSVYQPQVLLNRQKCQSIRVRVEEIPISGSQRSLTLNELGATVGLKAGLNKVPARKVR